jgi:MFS transporter, AAHS family, 4-hydroxybenzoate transporter
MTTNNTQAHLKELIDNNPMSVYQIIIVAICFILNMNDGIDVLVVSFSGADIAKEWALTKTQLGAIFSAGLFGMTAGCLLLAPQGDKMGRRKVFLISLSLITIGMLCIYFTAEYWQVLICRVVTGLGIGGILPTMASTASEFSSNKRRDFNVSLVQAGWPFGAIFTGFFCAWAIPIYGWRFAFLLAGFISMFMLIGVYFFMTDSLEYLSKKQPKNALGKINNLLYKMGHQPIQYLPQKPLAIEKTPLRRLFELEYKKDTIKLWIAAFFGFLTLYTMMSWVPNIAKDAGLPFEMATYVGIAMNVGAAIGSGTLGLFAAKYGLKKTVMITLFCAFTVMQIYGNIPLSTAMIFLIIFLIGLFVQGGFNGLWPISSRVYPAEIRSTGVGLSFGVGRFGAIIGPYFFGRFSDAGLSTTSLFIIFSVPLLVTLACIWSLKSGNLKA